MKEFVKKGIVFTVRLVIMLMLTVIIMSLKNYHVKADYSFSYENDGGDTVMVTVSGINNNNYIRFPFGYETRGAYVRAKIDTDMVDGPDTWVWLCEDGPAGGCKDNTLGVKEHSMFWFTRNDFTDTEADGTTRVGVMVSEYLQDYMKRFYPAVAAYNFRHEIQCEFVWCFSVQALADTIVVGKKPDGSPVTIGSRMSLSENGKGLVRTAAFNIPTDGGADLNAAVSGFDFRKRISAAVKYHYGNGSSLNEYLCYSYDDMKRAQLILARDFMGDASLATGFASINSDQSSFWNAWQVVRIDASVSNECNVHIGFYDVNVKEPVGDIVSEGFAQNVYEKNSKNKLLSDWKKYIGSNYQVDVKDSMAGYPAYQVAYDNSMPAFKNAKTAVKGYDPSNPDHSLGRLSAAGDIYYLNTVPDRDNLLVWIPLIKQVRLKIHFYEPENENSSFKGDYSTFDAGYISQGSEIGALNILNIFNEFKNDISRKVAMSEYEIDWSRGKSYSAKGFFAVRGDNPYISFDYIQAGGAEVHRFSNSVTEVSDPYFYLNANANDNKYTVIWVPVCKKKQPAEVYYSYYDSVSGKAITIDNQLYRNAVPNLAERKAEGVFTGIYIPEGYQLYTAISADFYATDSISDIRNPLPLGTAGAVGSGEYDSVIGRYKINAVPDNEYIMIRIPLEKKKTVSFTDVYAHYFYYENGEAKRIGTKGVKIGQLQQGVKKQSIDIGSVMEIPAAYEYKGGEIIISYGDDLSMVANRIEAIASDSVLSGSKEGFPPTVTIRSAIPECKYICVWIPLVKKVSRTELSIQFIDANTGVNIGKNLSLDTVSRNTVFAPLNYKDECLSGINVEGSYSLDLSGCYGAKAIYSEDNDIANIAYNEAEKYKKITFSSQSLCKFIIPAGEGEVLSVKVFVPLSYKEQLKDKDRKLRIVYYNADSEQNETIKTDGDYIIPSVNGWYVPGRISESLIYNGKRYNRSVSDSYVYFAADEGFLNTPFGERNILEQGRFEDKEYGRFTINRTASEYLLYIGMSEGRTSISAAFIDKNTGAVIKISNDDKVFKNTMSLYEFDAEQIIFFNDKAYRPCDKKHEAKAAYKVRAIYPAFEITMFPDYDWPETRLSYYGAKQFFTLDKEECYMFGSAGSVLINIGDKNISKLYLFIPCDVVKPVEIHCVSEDEKDSVDFLESYSLYIAEGEKAEKELTSLLVDGVEYTPMLSGSLAIAGKDICDAKPEAEGAEFRYRYCRKCFGTGKEGVSYCKNCTSGANIDNPNTYTLYTRHKNYYSVDGLSESEADWIINNVRWRPGLELSSGSLRQCESCGKWSEFYTYSSYHGKSYYYTGFNSYGYFSNSFERNCSACDGTGYEKVEIYKSAVCPDCKKSYYSPKKHLISNSEESRYLTSVECMLKEDIRKICENSIYKTLSYNSAEKSGYKIIESSVEYNEGKYIAATQDTAYVYGHTVMYVLYAAEAQNVIVKYVSLDSDGDIDKLIKECEGDKVNYDREYIYNGESELTVEGVKYNVTGKDALLVYGNNSYEDFRDYGRTDMGQQLIYNGSGKWTTKGKYSSKEDAVLYIPVKRSEIQSRVVYISVNSNGKMESILKAEDGPAVCPGDYYIYNSLLYLDDNKGNVYSISRFLPLIAYGGQNAYDLIDRNRPDNSWMKVVRRDKNKWMSQNVLPEVNELTLFIPMERESKSEAPKIEAQEDIEVKYTGPNAYAAVKAQDASGFDVNRAIPSSEGIYSKVKASRYILDAAFKNITGEKEYRVVVEQPYNIIDLITKKEQTIVKKRTVTVKRNYSYWTIDHIRYYRLNNAVIMNDSLVGRPDRKNMTVDFTKLLSMDADGPVHIPLISDERYTKEEEHINVLELTHLELPTVDVYVNDTSADIDELSEAVALAAAEKAVKEIKVKNDGMSFDGNIVMNSEWCDRAAERPNTDAIAAPELLTGRSEDIEIPGQTLNGCYESSGLVTYVPVTIINSMPENSRYLIENINSVRVHTPIAVKMSIKDDNLNYVQFIDSSTDDTTAHAVIGRSDSFGSSENENSSNDFTVEISLAGRHLDQSRYPGYGTRDYSKYINSVNDEKDIKISFECDVMADVNSDKNESDDLLIKAGSWNSVYDRYYIPEWVKEGEYKVKVMAAAINSYDGADEQQRVNTDPSAYYVYDEFKIEVSGKLYGLTLNSVNSNAYDWKNVFYDNSKMKCRFPDKYEDGSFSREFDSLKRYYYSSGSKNELGLPTKRIDRYTLPLIDGASPVSKDYGMLKSGYIWNFSLKTVGRKTANDAAYVKIVPSFYWLSPDGRERHRADIRYDTVIDGKRINYLKAGSSTDSKKLFYSYAGANTMGIPVNLLNENEIIRGNKKLINENTAVYSYGQILIDKHLKMFSGSGYAGLMEAKQSGYSKSQLSQTEQTWYFCYGLPDSYHVTEYGYDVDSYVEKHGACNYEEEFWKKDGYLIVHFDIAAYDKNGKLIMTYSNSKTNLLNGMCNMWKMEGYQIKKTDSSGQEFIFEEGDVIIVRIPGSTSENGSRTPKPPTNYSEDRMTDHLN